MQAEGETAFPFINLNGYVEADLLNLYIYILNQFPGNSSSSLISASLMAKMKASCSSFNNTDPVC